MTSKSISFPVTEAKRQLLLDRMADCGLNESDLEETFIRSSGPGGQNVNKTATCVFLRHLPTGLEVKCSKARTQGLNRYYSRKIMCQLLENKKMGKQSPEATKAEKIRKQKNRRKRRTSS